MCLRGKKCKKVKMLTSFIRKTCKTGKKRKFGLLTHKHCFLPPRAKKCGQHYFFFLLHFFRTPPVM